MSYGRSSLPSDSVPVVEDSVPSVGRVCGDDLLVSLHAELVMNYTRLLGTPLFVLPRISPSMSLAPGELQSGHVPIYE